MPNFLKWRDIFMKRTLSLVLAMLMVMTCITSLSVVSVSAEGTPGTITVFLRDFEDGVKQSSDAGKINSVLDDGTGNKYGAVSIDPDELASLPKADAADKRSFVVLAYRLIVGKKIPYISGKKYALSWDLAKVSAGTVSALDAGTSGINSMSGANKILGWRSNKWNAFNQYYLSLGAYTGENNTGDRAKQTQENLSSGWRRYTGKPFNYLLTTSDKDTTPAPNGTVGTIDSFFFEVSIYDALLKLLIANKAYVGPGFTQADGKGGEEPLEGYTFTIEPGDLYGDEVGLVANGGTFTEDQLCREWSLGEDCSALKSATRSAAFAQVMEEANFGFGIDNVTFSAETTYYTDTVKIKGDATVRAITNTGSGCTESTAVANGGTVTVNDYFGTTYEITTAYQPTVTYNGTAVTPVLSDGVYKVVIPGSDITSDGTLNISVPSSVTVFSDNFNAYEEGSLTNGWNVINPSGYEGAFETDETGNTYIVIKNFKAQTLINAWKKVNNNVVREDVFDFYPRFTKSAPGFKVNAGKEYTYSFKYKYMDNGTNMSNASQAQPFFNFSGASLDKWANTGWGSWAAAGAPRTQFYVSTSGNEGENGWRSATAPTFTATEIHTTRDGAESVSSIDVANLQLEFKGLNQGKEESHVLYQLTKQAIDENTVDGVLNEAAATTRLQALLDARNLKICLDDVKITFLSEEVTVSANISDGGSVKVDGANVANGDAITLEKGVEAEIAVTPASGYEIEAVSFAGEDVTPVKVDEACVIKVTPNANAALVVSFKDVTPKTPTISLGEKQNSNSFILNGTTYNEFNCIQYVKIDNYNAALLEKAGVTVSDGTNSIELPVDTISQDGCFAVRVFGDAITERGTYTFTPFMVTK
mgnify:CR=1 FL=1